MSEGIKEWNGGTIECYLLVCFLRGRDSCDEPKNYEHFGGLVKNKVHI